MRKNSVDVGGMVGEGYKREGKLEGREQFGREGDVSLIENESLENFHDLSSDMLVIHENSWCPSMYFQKQ